jgi:hypothetical protein
MQKKYMLITDLNIRILSRYPMMSLKVVNVKNVKINEKKA